MSEPCMKSDVIKRIQTDISEINTRLEKHEGKFDRMNDTNLVLERTVTLLEEMRGDAKDQKEFNKQMTDTLAAIQSTMIETTFSMKEVVASQEKTNAKISDMSSEYNQKFDDTYKRIEDTTQKVIEANKRGKIEIDLWDYIKRYLVPFFLGGGALGGLYALVQKLF